MTDPLYKIVYCSRNLIEGEPAEHDAEIDQILQSARKNNTRQNVTGALLFSSGYFAQVLEGPQPAIERIFEHIQRDPRHGDVTVLESGDAERRDFPDWAMAHVHPPSTDTSGTLSSLLSGALLRPTAEGGDVLELLKSLVIQEG